MGFRFTLSAKEFRQLFVILVAFELFLVVMYLVDLSDISWVFPTAFNLDGEATIPAWFSSMQLFTIGLIFLFSRNWPNSLQLNTPGLMVFAGLCFIFLSADEAATLHEMVTSVLKSVDWLPRFKGDHGVWISMYLVIFLGLIAYSFRTILSFFRIYPSQAKMMLTGACIFIFGAVGLEIISYQYLRGDETSFYYKLEVAFEELFEMLGATLILIGTIKCAVYEEPQIDGQ